MREQGIGSLRTIVWIVLSAIITGVLSRAPAASAQTTEGIAVGIVYDTSGSMAEMVNDQAGKRAPKYVIAARALSAIVDRLQAYVAKAPAGETRHLETGLYVFDNAHAKAAVPFGPFDADALRQWMRSFSQPGGTTPLGNAVRTASEAVLKSPYRHKHVLVVTDGQNTAGPEPAQVISGLRTQAAHSQLNLQIHFVAFDVAAKIFDPLKQLGVTVVGAEDEAQLNTQLGYILEQKILLEDEEPPAAAPHKP